MNITAKTEIRALATAEMDEISGGAGMFASSLTAGSPTVATAAEPKRLALRIMSEHMERQTQVVQKIAS